MDSALNIIVRVKRNDDILWNIEVTEDGVAVDITGWIFFFTVKDSLDDLDAAALIKVDWSLHDDAEAGLTSLNVPKESTNLTGMKEFDLQYKKPSGFVNTFLSGKIDFGKDATIRTVPV